MKRILFVLIFLCGLSLYSAEKIYGDALIERVVRIIDGDTIVIDIKDYPPIIGKDISIRIYGIDTAEKNDKRENIRKLSLEAKRVTTEMLSRANVIELRNMRRGKYFRIVGDIYVDGICLGDYLIMKELAKPYYGGTKEAW